MTINWFILYSVYTSSTVDSVLFVFGTTWIFEIFGHLPNLLYRLTLAYKKDVLRNSRLIARLKLIINTGLYLQNLKWPISDRKIRYTGVFGIAVHVSEVGFAKFNIADSRWWTKVNIKWINRCSQFDMWRFWSCII